MVTKKNIPASSSFMCNVSIKTGATASPWDTPSDNNHMCFAGVSSDSQSIGRHPSSHYYPLSRRITQSNKPFGSCASVPKHRNQPLRPLDDAHDTLRVFTFAPQRRSATYVCVGLTCSVFAVYSWQPTNIKTYTGKSCGRFAQLNSLTDGEEVMCHDPSCAQTVEASAWSFCYPSTCQGSCRCYFMLLRL